MGKLTDWINNNCVISQEKFNENDLTMNEHIRNIFFDQVENLEFDSKEIEGKHGSFLLSFRLDFPLKNKMPYTFIFETGKNIIIPQYTITHRVYKAPLNTVEHTILENLEAYLMQNPTNKGKDNPKNKRDRSKNFVTVQGVRCGDLIIFSSDSFENLGMNDEDVVFYMGDRDTIIGYVKGNEITIMPEFHDVHISRIMNFNVDDNQCKKGYCMINVPGAFDTETFFMESKH